LAIAVGIVRCLPLRPYSPPGILTYENITNLISIDCDHTGRSEIRQVTIGLLALFEIDSVVQWVSTVALAGRKGLGCVVLLEVAVCK